MDSIVEVAVLIICLIAYAAVRKSRKPSKGQKKNAAPPAGEKSGSFKEQMADLARDLAANDGDALDMLINELRSAPSEGPAEGESARRPRATGEIADGPQPAARLAQMPSEAPSSPQAPSAPRRAEAQPAPVDFAAARRKLRAKAKPADKKAAASAPAQAVRLDGLPAARAPWMRRAASAVRSARIVKRASAGRSIACTSAGAKPLSRPNARPPAAPQPCARRTSTSCGRRSSCRRFWTNRRRSGGGEPPPPDEPVDEPHSVIPGKATVPEETTIVAVAHTYPNSHLFSSSDQDYVIARAIDI